MFQLLAGKWRPLRYRPLCFTPNLPNPTICQLETGPFSSTCRCLFNQLEKHSGYAFPPFALIGRCLQQVMNQEIDQLILVAPIWPAQPWYPVLLRVCTDFPLLFPMSPTLLMRDNQPHPLTNLQLAGWRLSANVTKQQRFQSQLEAYCWQPGERTPPPLIHEPGINGSAGVINGKSIPFQLA